MNELGNTTLSAKHFANVIGYRAVALPSLLVDVKI